MYEIWYTPRIHDDVLCWKFETEGDAHEAMTKLKSHRPKAFPHHYIWNTVTKKKIKPVNLISVVRKGDKLL